MYVFIITVVIIYAFMIVVQAHLGTGISKLALWHVYKLHTCPCTV